MPPEEIRSQQNVAQSLTLDLNNLLYIVRQGQLRIPERDAILLVFKPYFSQLQSMGGYIMEIVAKRDFRGEDEEIVARFSIPNLKQDAVGFVDTNIEADETLVLKHIDTVFGEVASVIAQHHDHIIVFRFMEG
jgi:hypothetical protein